MTITILNEIAAERHRQIEVEGWTYERDDQYLNHELALAASAYAYGVHFTAPQRRVGFRPSWWPFSSGWWKPTSRRRDLIKAAALIVAEIERMDREETQFDPFDLKPEQKK